MALAIHIKNIDFNHLVFSKPLIQQAEIFTNLLIETRSKFIPSTIIYIRLTDEPWTNTYTVLLLRKRTKNYQLFKKKKELIVNIRLPRTVQISPLTLLHRYATTTKNFFLQFESQPNNQNMSIGGLKITSKTRLIRQWKIWKLLLRKI